MKYCSQHLLSLLILWVPLCIVAQEENALQEVDPSTQSAPVHREEIYIFNEVFWWTYSNFDGGSDYLGLVNNSLSIWSNTGDYDWTWYSGSTPTSFTGPTTDNTDGTGHYMYVEASSPNNPSKTFILEAELGGNGLGYITFYYHMYGDNMGRLNLDTSPDNGATWNSIWTKSGNQGDSWQTATITMDDGTAEKIRFNGTTGDGLAGDMALDDIYITEWATPAPTELPIIPPSPAPSVSIKPSMVPTIEPTSSPTGTPKPSSLPTQHPTFITQSGGHETLREELSKSGATITIEKDIYIIETIVIYNVTGITILGNLFKIDGRSGVRCLYIGDYEESNKQVNKHANTEVRIELLVITNGFDSYNGGGMYVYGTKTVVTMYECVIVDNSAGFTGGGIYTQSGASLAITGTTFTSNNAGNEGNDVYLGNDVVFSTTGCDGDGDASSTYLDCGTDSVVECTSTYYSYICASQAPTVLPSQPTLNPTQPSLVPTFYEPTPLPTSEPTFAGPHLNMTFCPVWPLPRPDMYNCEMRKPNFNVHNSREVGVFPTLTEGRDYFYAHPLRIFRTLEVVSESGKDIKSAFISFQDSTGDGVADYTSGDYLYFYDTDNIKGTYSKGAGTLRIKGRDTPAAYEDAIREVGYRASEFEFLNLVSAGNQIPRNVSIVVNDVQGYSSEILYREFEVIGSKRMYSENAVGRIVCTSQLCGGLGTYVFTGI
mmetsp:Transcript_17099/g.20126  ORF Transcript_17099/g.20126 Transcript_17099/m.20126 type:complete len:713 (-) Transcript_17099:65-2203(-)